MQSINEDQFKGLRFCQDCLNILHPRVNDEGILEFICKTCDNIERVRNQGSIEEALIYRNELVRSKQQVIIDPEFCHDPTMMRKKNVCCPKCKHNEAVYFLHTVTQDTHLQLLYICAKQDTTGKSVCGNCWEDTTTKTKREKLEAPKDEMEEEFDE